MHKNMGVADEMSGFGSLWKHWFLIMKLSIAILKFTLINFW